MNIKYVHCTPKSIECAQLEIFEMLILITVISQTSFSAAEHAVLAFSMAQSELNAANRTVRC